MTQLDRLPTELFYDVLKYFWAHEALHSFSNLNDRIDAILKSYPTYRINCRSIRKSAFHHICEWISPEQVISLILSDENDTPSQSKLFLSYFQIEQFINLRSISLIEINYGSLREILPSLSQLKQLQAVSLDDFGGKEIRIDSRDNRRTPHMNICSSSHRFCAEIFLRLRYLCTNYSEVLTVMHFPNLLHLKLNSGTLMSNVNKIFQHAPQLQSLTLCLSNLYDFTGGQPCYSLTQLSVTSAGKYENSIFSSEFKPLVEKRLKPLCKTEHIFVGVTMSLNEIGQFLRNFPNLTHFEVKILYQNVDMTMATGYYWQTITQSLSSFSFKFRLQSEMYVNSFRTPFWVEEKRWFVAYHDRYLFTISDFALPYANISSNSFLYSTVPNHPILYRPQSSIVHERASLTHNFRFSSVKTLELFWNDRWENLISIFDLEQVEDLSIGPASYPLLKYIQHHMPKLHTLSLANSSGISEILRICGLEPFKQKIKSDMISFIDKFKQLTSVSFVVHKSMKNTILASQYDPSLIINRIEQYLHCTATCQPEYPSEYCSTPKRLHLWLGKRSLNDQRQSQLGFVWCQMKKLFEQSSKTDQDS
ncbi:unnamed protein product [Adineta ricciae]|uniref:F-box domain-containing protein n=1 Tax=Adineta ricciae TaxID=249248 RepID=A0A814WP86_ADIRI|nr:unnamed protein product [Adineta ricciae]